MILCVCPNPSVDTYLWIEHLSPGDTHRVSREARFPGGKGTHVALALSELGEESKLAGFWAGPTGAWIQEECKKYGVSCMGTEVPGWTRTCLTFQSSGSYQDTEVLGLGPTISKEAVDDFCQKVDAHLSKISAMTLSGSWPEGTRGDYYARLIRLAKAKRIPVYVDCTGSEFNAALNECPQGIHLNRAEAHAVTGETDMVIAARQLAQKASMAIVSDGSEGLYLAVGPAVIHARCSIKNPLSSVGSGDCLLAGMAIAGARSFPAAEVARWAAACGAANCLRAELGMLNSEEVRRLLPLVEIRSNL